MFYYKAFSLNIKSEIECPELLPFVMSESEVDVTIALGKTPTELQGEDIVKRVRHWSRPNEFLLQFQEIVRYHAFDGKNVVIEPLQDEHIDWKSIRIFLLGSIMTSILHQRGILPLHASAVKKDNGVILFCGISGAGKSTTAAFLHQRGYPIFTDDLCIIRSEDIQDQQVLAYPSYPMTRHWKDTIEALDDNRFEAKRHVRAEINKFQNFFHERFELKALPIQQICFLQEHHLPELKVEKLNNAILIVDELRRNTFRKGQLRGLGGQSAHFKKLVKIASTVPVYRFYRPSHGHSIQDFIDFVEDEITRTTTA